uniref:LRRCT domain-containing protein n=1 Tax=Oryzias sinensis TaxID=183150 RepID=A0A8C7XH21_9TELE
EESLLWATLLFSIFPLFYCSASCPSSCQCNPHGEVICVGYTITEIPKNLPVHTYTLKLNDTNMNVIKEHSLAHQDLLLRFSLTHSHLHTIHDLAFHAAPQLKSVKLSSNDLSTLPARVFSPLTTVEEIYLDGNQLETLAPEMFEGLAALLVLDLTRNKLTGPGAGIFDGLTNLTVLNLGRNNIKKFPKNIFHSLTKLRRLRVYNNELESLEEGIFDQLTSLEELILHGNKIEGIAPQVFWSLGKLKILTLSGNHLQTVPHKSFYNMPELSKLTIYKNPLLSLPNELMGHMPDMREFYLFSTNLTTIPENLFANMSGLLRLNLHLNDKLRQLPPDVFCCLPHLQKLSLLPEDSLPGDIFSSNAALRILNLSKNPWDCNCAIRDFARWIRNNPRIVVDIDDVLCHSPTYHVLRRVNSLRDDEFTYCDEKRIQTSLYEPVKTTHVSTTTEEVRRYSTATAAHMEINCFFFFVGSTL